MKIKTAELVGWQLDWAVNQIKKAGAEPHAVTSLSEGKHTRMRFDQRWVDGCKIWDTYSPSTIWAQGGPIIEREKIGMKFDHDLNEWAAWLKYVQDVRNMPCPTPLIAAMRCYVASKLGDEVEVP